MKQVINHPFIAAMLLFGSLAHAETGLLFKIAESGATASVDVILCLNGKGPLSCQNYHVSAQDLQISTAANHHYPAAGIKVLTPGYHATGCTFYPKTGYCLFATSNTTPATIHLNSRAITISSPTLVLAQAGIFTSASGASVGASKSRTLTITNQGQVTATNLSIVFNPALSGGTSMDTSVSTACTSSTALAYNDSCTVTIIPGTPSSIGSAPITNTMTVTATNASNSVTSDIITLTYGSLYGGGYVFSIDDSTASTSSVGLVKVAAISDQNPQTPSVSYLPWDADLACAIGPNYICTYSTGATSTTNGTNLSGGNTYLIWNKLTNTAPSNPPTFPETITSYAAGACINYTGGGHGDWYLPAICEMAYFASGNNPANCGSSSIPALQNMQSNLIDIDNTSSVASGLFNGGYIGGYWSSTENSDLPFVVAWSQIFASNGGSSFKGVDVKGYLWGVRCVRGFTN